jgi:hypothetical protein
MFWLSNGFREPSAHNFAGGFEQFEQFPCTKRHRGSRFDQDPDGLRNANRNVAALRIKPWTSLPHPRLEEEQVVWGGIRRGK